MLLQVTSIGFVTAINLLIFSLAFFVQWLRERDLSMRDWAIGFWLGSVACVLFGARGLIGMQGIAGDMVSMTAAGTLFICVYVFTYIGLCRQFGIESWRRAWLAPILTCALYSYFIAVDYEPSAWPVITGCMRFAVCAMLSALLLRHRGRISIYAMLLLQTSLVVMGLFMLAAGFMNSWLTTHGLIATSNLPAINYIVAAVCTFMMMMGLLSLHTDRLLAKLEDAANTDVLTGLRNRRFFNEIGRAEMDRSIRDGLTLWVLMIDIDHFKDINDTLGHAEGDRVLNQVSQVFRASLRSYDLVARYGGEEFCALLPNTDDLAARAVAERLLHLVGELRIGPQQNHTVTVSIGAAQRGDGDRLLEDILKRADHALYEAKAAGRNRIVGFADLAAPLTKLPVAGNA